MTVRPSSRSPLVPCPATPIVRPTASAALLALLEVWIFGPITVTLETTDGRYQIVAGTAEGVPERRTWIYDTTTEQLLTPYVDGLGNGWASDVSLSVDEMTVRTPPAAVLAGGTATTSNTTSQPVSERQSSSGRLRPPVSGMSRTTPRVPISESIQLAIRSSFAATSRLA